MRNCSDNHDEIIFKGNECPLCKQRLLMDQVLDDQEQIDQDNIMNLYRELEELKKRLAGIELLMGIHVVKRRWPWQPLRYAHLSENAKLFEH